MYRQFVEQLPVVVLVRLGLFSLFSVVCFSVTSASAAVSGKCVACHTMHYSQDGRILQEWGDEGPYSALLTTDCIGCHMGTNAGGDTPFIMSGSAPLYAETGTEPNTNTLAGGSFYWVASGDHNKGHNVVGLIGPDPLLSIPPGFDGTLSAADGSIPGGGSWPAGRQVTCAGTYGCHGTHTEIIPESAIAGGHHKGVDGAITDPGVLPARGYRMLIGVAGYEDPDWELTPTATEHNQYKGTDGLQDKATISSLCMRCHNSFHSDGNSSSGWLRHPVDFDMGNTGSDSEVRGYGGIGNQYRVDVPVASVDVSMPLEQVTFQDDTIVSCISCHRSHGSPYDKLLRWDYAGSIGQCTACHTSKD